MSATDAAAGAVPEGVAGEARGPGGREGDEPRAPGAASGGPPASVPLVITEVSGYEGSLMSAIEREFVEKPILMSFNDWISWRKEHGKRPITRRDGVGTQPRQESALWRSTMAALYGENWRTDLDALEEAGAEEEDEPPGFGAAPAVGAGISAEPKRAATPPLPAATATVTGTVSAGAPATRGAAVSAGGTKTPGRASRSSSVPSSPGEMRRKLFGADASNYSVAEFENRLVRFTEGLEKADKPLSTDELQYVLQKAQYARTLRDVPREQQLRMLKELTGDIVLERTHSREKEVKMSVLMDMIRDRQDEDGGKDSTAVTTGVAGGSRLDSSKSGSEESSPEKKAQKEKEERERRARERSGGKGADGPRGDAGRDDKDHSAARADELSGKDVRAALDRLAALEKQIADKDKTSGQNLVDAMKDQTKVIAEALKSGKDKTLGSTIKITPQVKWPTLGDEEGQDKCDVEEFFEKFDENCDLANDANGMLPAERLTVLKSCLKGAKEKILS